MEELNSHSWNDNKELNSHSWKYNEDIILKDIENYILNTYNSHYSGRNKNIQIIDFMESKNLATNFCQANILKYGSRYGDKDGYNKKDLLKVIHYAILLLHYNHYCDIVNNTSI